VCGTFAEDRPLQAAQRMRAERGKPPMSTPPTRFQDFAGLPVWDLADECLNLGECLYDPELHDGPADPARETPGERAAREQVATEVCAVCPAQAACREYALRTRPDRGMWAGLTSADIAALADALGTEREAA